MSADLVSDLEPADGWWKSSTGESLNDAVETLRRHRIPDTVITGVLDRIVGAIRAEYGE